MNRHTDWTGPLETSLDPLEAFDAMRIFLERYWERGGKASNDLAVLLGSIGPWENGAPMDIAQWDDWRFAVAQAKQRSSP